MKVSGALLLLVLIAAFCCQADSSPDAPSTPITCCFDFTTKIIPPKLVVSYEITSDRCARKAVVLVTKRGYNICSNPEAQWVQNIRNRLDKMNAKTQSP
ncbi:C-C motif chemokine 2-like [Macrotis lagotis]|uniref:C-C motif chemokine 2-like n=1 Tax=Macrotis lagotis TaxID=92651 RepID=UPI003D695F26